jgi:hypothetical protein
MRYGCFAKNGCGVVQCNFPKAALIFVLQLIILAIFDQLHLYNFYVCVWIVKRACNEILNMLCSQSLIAISS